MQQTKKVKDEAPEQIFYNERWVDKKHFRAFVWNDKDEKKLADNYEEYERLLASGLWFSDKKIESQEKVVKLRKSKDGNSNG